MKLNLEQLVVTSFATVSAAKSGPKALRTPYCTYDPTAATECFVCPAPSSPTDGC